MADTGAPPVIPPELQQYNSYVEDPKWQIKFTIAWTSVLAFFVLTTLPSVFRSRSKWIPQAFGVSENWRGRYARLGSEQEDDDPEAVMMSPDQPPESEERKVCKRVASRSELFYPVARRSTMQSLILRVTSAVGAALYWTPPGIGLNAGQFLLVAGYAGTVLACICTSAPLLSNSNRAGFLAISQLPVVFLLGSKNTILSLLLPPFYSYIQLNALHRWAGRTLFLSAVLHGSMWIANHVEWGLPILGQQKETSGVAALGILGVVVVSSLRPVRMWAWGIFYWIHFLAVPALFIVICYHTVYAPPWIFPPIAFYAFDLLMRAGRFRLKDAYLVAVDDQMTIIHIPDCDAGFRAGQHLRIRVLFGGRGFEAHPLSIMCAPSSSAAVGNQTTCVRTKDVMAYHDDDDKDADAMTALISDTTPGILLGARVSGDWTKALNGYTRKREEEEMTLARAVAVKSAAAAEETPTPPGGSSSASSVVVPSSSSDSRRIPIPVQVVFDGPYGGCSLDLQGYERVLLVAGGSGATFIIGLLDELVAGSLLILGRKSRARTRKVHFVWCTRSLGSIKWFAPLLRCIARTAALPSSPISLRMTVYVTCMCAPEDVDIPGLEIRIGGRPNMSQLVGAIAGLLTPADDDADGDGDNAPEVNNGEDHEELCDCGCLNEALSNQAQQEKEDRGKAAAAAKDVEKQGGGGGGNVFNGALAVCASGPESLTREAANTVAWYASRGREVGLHTEVFAV